ncbi:MAG: hypothetical protein K9N57_00125 [Candidatus Marinimicrobia bacterium]|nr:hypothetical protein [Candidatus Neomarinimicrobiota bacterium]
MYQRFKKYRNLFVAGIVGFAVLTTNAVVGQTTEQLTSEYHPWKWQPNARTFAMGTPMTGITNQLNDMYANPALLSFQEVTKSISISQNYYWTQGVIAENVTIPVLTNRTFPLAVGFTAHHSGLDPIEANQPLKKFSRFDGHIGGAVKVSNTVSLGALVQMNHNMASDNYKRSASALAGAYYAPSPGVSYGIRYHYYEDDVAFRSDFSGEEALMESRDVPNLIEVGTSMRFPEVSESPLVILSFASEKRSSQSGVTYKGGIEYHPLSLIDFRAGYLHGPNYVGGRYGIGLKLGRQFQVDIAHGPGYVGRSVTTINLQIHLPE